ncbi:hypothetical protein EUGRSUZ_L03302 [Eucalyptus grandis]|uniref:Uncharacterized protein n=1 Tax=Eucalyptus grandis TaxID=71139 RepID=A0AAD9T883_EUCGR|nr:hypothetical protein EUGRSUZ_L03302 [Eucalyptus grandis]
MLALDAAGHRWMALVPPLDGARPPVMPLTTMPPLLPSTLLTPRSHCRWTTLAPSGPALTTWLKLFHIVSSMAAPATDSEKLICTVLEAERPEISHLHGKSLLEANESFLDKHKDSLMHRVP